MTLQVKTQLMIGLFYHLLLSDIGLNVMNKYTNILVKNYVKPTTLLNIAAISVSFTSFKDWMRVLQVAGFS